jgi:hypothetical protein
MITVRQVLPEDMPTLTAWAEERGCVLEPLLLSPHGFLAESKGSPVLAVWAYMLLDVPVIALDNLFSRPQTSAKVIRAALADVFRVIQDWMKRLNELGGVNYCVIRTFINSRLAIEAEKLGWKTAGNYTQATLTHHG